MSLYYLLSVTTCFADCCKFILFGNEDSISLEQAFDLLVKKLRPHRAPVSTPGLNCLPAVVCSESAVIAQEIGFLMPAGEAWVWFMASSFQPWHSPSSGWH